MCQATFDVLDRNADHVAPMTHCAVTKAWSTRTRGGLPNHAMAELTFRNFEKLGAPEWREEAKVFGRELQKSLALEPMQEPFFEGLSKLTPPWEAETAFRPQLLPGSSTTRPTTMSTTLGTRRPCASIWSVRHCKRRSPDIAIRSGAGMRWVACRPASIRCGVKPRR